MKYAGIQVAALIALTAATGYGRFPAESVPAFVSALSNQHTAAIASGDDNSLVVWCDSRVGVTDIYGARMNSQGTLLDVAGIAISTAPGAQQHPAVAFNGTDYLVVWSGPRGSDSSDILGARISQDGVVLDPEGFVITAAAGVQAEPAVASNGSGYLVVWSDQRRGDTALIYGSRVTTDGVVLDVDGIAVDTVSAFHALPATAFDGDNYMVVWEDARGGQLSDVRGTQVAPDGSVVAPGGFIISEAASWQSAPAVAAGSGGLLVVWSDYRNGAQSDVYGARVSRDGSVLDTAGLAVSAIPNYQWYPSVAFDGASYIVAWQDERGHGDIFGARVAPDGRLLDSLGFVIRGDGFDQSSPAAACDGSNFVVAWDDTRMSPSDVNVYAARITRNGEVVDPNSILLSKAAAVQDQPAAASDGLDFLCVWEDGRCGSDPAVFGTRVSSGGEVLDPKAFQVSCTSGGHRSSVLASNGLDYLAVWEEGAGSGRDIRAARIASTGAVRDTVEIRVSSAAREQFCPALASDGADFLVVWQDWRHANLDIYGARVLQDGAVPDTGIPIAAGSGEQFLPAVAYGDSGFLVTWMRNSTASVVLQGARLTVNGSRIDSVTIPITSVGAAPVSHALAYGNGGYLAVWCDRRTGDGGVYAARVTRQGELLDSAGIPVSLTTVDPTAPVVVSDGTDFLIVWQDSRGAGDLYGARVSPGGVVLDTFPVSSQDGVQRAPALAARGDQGLLLAYSGWTSVLGPLPCYSMRVWGDVALTSGVRSESRDQVRSSVTVPTIVKGFIDITTATPGQNATGELIDINGRRVRKLTSGRNDIRHLSPGVYFLRTAIAGDSERSTKLVVQH